MTVDGFRIMKQQVSLRDYGAASPPAPARRPTLPALRQTSRSPASAISTPTAMPTGIRKSTGRILAASDRAEAAAAAGERFRRRSFSARRTIPTIRRCAGSGATARKPRRSAPAGPAAEARRPLRRQHAIGVEDFGGNVWEWTSTCYVRVSSVLTG